MKYIAKYLIYSKTSGKPHVISKCEDGTWACDCLGWTSHYPRKNCTHIRYVIATSPEPLDLINWEKLRMRKGKVKKALELFRKTSSTSISAEL